MGIKAIWQKAAGIDSRSAPGGSAVAPDSEILGRLTHTSAWHLQRLEKLLELRFQRQSGELNDARLRELIRYASRVQDQEIQRELLLFYLNCPPSVQLYLRNGDIVDENHLLHRAPDPGA